MEAEPDGPAVQGPLGAVHQGQGGDARAHQHPRGPWSIVEGNDKKQARLNCIAHLLQQIPYAEVPHDPITLPDRVFNPDYERKVLPDELYVPKVY